VPRALVRNIDLGFDDASDPVTISADPFLLREMLNNLIDNAISYAPDGGHVTLRIRRSGGAALIEVEDNGSGIPAAERVKVFERFYRIPGSRTEGCGLGLAIVREIAQGHGATPVITTGADGRGTRVTVTFPLPG
jgi:two-component system sensor histidine kinase TctE